MSHLRAQTIHVFASRGQDISVDVETSGDPEDFTSIGFRVQGELSKTGLTAEAGGNGILVDFTLSDEDLAIDPAMYEWECYATVANNVKTLAYGLFIVDPEPTEEESS